MKKVLIVDDEDTIRGLVRRSLEEDGYELEEARCGEEALTRSREFRPDLVVLDLMMPDLWGFEVCERIKEHPDTRGTLVLLLTGRGSLPSRRHGENKGADGYLVKPFKPSELRDRVKQLLGDG